MPVTPLGLLGGWGKVTSLYSEGFINHYSATPINGTITLMILMDLLGWWYIRGWEQVIHHFFIERSRRTLTFFSFSDLIRTFFAPYRQTFSGQVRGGLGDKFRGFVDRTISRVIGAMVRGGLLVGGIIFLCMNLVLGIVASVAWPFVPLLPAIGLISAFFGVGNYGA